MKLKEVSKFVKEFGRDWWKWFAAFAASVLFLISIYEPADKRSKGWVLTHVRLDQGHLAVDDRVHIVLAILALVSIFVFVGVAFTSAKLFLLKKETAETSRTKDVLERTFEKTVEAADQISEQLFPSTGKVVKKVISCKQIYTLYDNGDCYFTEDMVVDAATRDLHFMSKIIGGEPEADPAEFPADIDLNIVSLTHGNSVKYLITENQPRYKSFAIFFLPVIELGANDPREVRTEYYWKGLLKKLLLKGQEGFELEVKSAVAVHEVEYQFWVKPGVGTLQCDNVGGKLPPGSETLKQASDSKGLKGWIYKAQAVPPGHITKLNLQLTRS